MYHGLLMTVLTLQRKSDPGAPPSLTALARQLKALGDPTRLAIVALLAQREHCVCDLTGALRLPQSTCSHHLGVLKRAGLIRDRQDGRDGRWSYYAIAPESAEALRAHVGTLLDLRGFDPTPVDAGTKLTRIFTVMRGNFDAAIAVV
jgi:ArsR family transcriptional regulator